MKKPIIILVTIFAFFFGIFSFNLFRPAKKSIENTTGFQNFQNSAEFNVSNLKNGETASFRAVLVKSPGSHCIQLFNPIDYEKYNGDPLWSATAKFAESDSKFSYFSWWRKEVTVEGKMTSIKNRNDAERDCGIVSGQIFEINKIIEK